MAKHTLGPWQVAGANLVYAPGENGGTICSCGAPRASRYVEYKEADIGSADFHESCANAHLISAAPDLLAAAKEAFEFSPFHGSDCEGVSTYEEGAIFDNTKRCTCYIGRLRAAIAKASGETSAK